MVGSFPERKYICSLTSLDIHDFLSPLQDYRLFFFSVLSTVIQKCSYHITRTERAKKNISFTSSMKSNTLIICSNLALLLFYINFNGVIILEIKETEWKCISKGKINQ